MFKVGFAVAICFLAVLAHSCAAAEPDGKQAKVEKALVLVQASAAKYTEEQTCFSCHHQALSAMAVAAAVGSGWAVDRAAARKQSEFTQKYFDGLRDKIAAGEGVVGGPYTAGYALVGLAADEWPADDVTAALVTYLFQRQQEDGRWKIQTHRPPLEDSGFTATALAVRGLQHYASVEQTQQVGECIAKAADWLMAADASSNEDQSFRLLGLAWCRKSGEPANTSVEEGDDDNAAPAQTPDDRERKLENAIEQAVARLLSEQRENGGWGQLAESQSDAYATGQAIVALRQVGVSAANQPAIGRGLDWLLTHQCDDGSWLVPTRSKPIQDYFESGFPHEESQFISISGTCWAVMALAGTDDAYPSKP